MVNFSCCKRIASELEYFACVDLFWGEVFLYSVDNFLRRILQKNDRGICPLDLAPELRKLQESCVESLFQTACTTNEEIAPPNHERVLRAAAMVNSTSSRQSKKLNVESG